MRTRRLIKLSVFLIVLVSGDATLKGQDGQLSQGDREKGDVKSSFSDKAKSYRDSPSYLSREFASAQGRIDQLRKVLENEGDFQKRVEVVGLINAYLSSLRRIREAAATHLGRAGKLQPHDIALIEPIMKANIPVDLPEPIGGTQHEGTQRRGQP